MTNSDSNYYFYPKSCLWSHYPSLCLTPPHLPCLGRTGGTVFLSPPLFFPYQQGLGRRGRYPSNKLIYIDTDSRFNSYGMENPLNSDSDLISPKELGKLKLEHVITEGYFLAPKFYGLKM